MADTPFLSIFLSSVYSVYQSAGGTKETSYYTALNNLLDGIGHTLKPKVSCVMQLQESWSRKPRRRAVHS
jgi:hypothetical protein